MRHLLAAKSSTTPKMLCSKCRFTCARSHDDAKGTDEDDDGDDDDEDDDDEDDDDNDDDDGSVAPAPRSASLAPPPSFSSHIFHQMSGRVRS